MEAAQKNAVPPEDLPNQIFKSIGACAIRYLGGMALGTRIGTFFLPYNVLLWQLLSYQIIRNIMQQGSQCIYHCSSCLVSRD